MNKHAKFLHSWKSQSCPRIHKIRFHSKGFGVVFVFCFLNGDTILLFFFFSNKTSFKNLNPALVG